MKANILFYICLTIFIDKVLLATIYYNDIDLKKYGKITVPASDGFIIFDSSDFSKGAKIYFKITASDFTDDAIYFEFYDDPNDYISNQNLAYVYPTDTSVKYDSVTNYYTIEKSSRNLGSLKGKYLIIYFYCLGNVEIENTKKDEALMISLIIVGIVIVVAIVVIIICYCRRKKRMAAMMKGYNGTQNFQVVNNNSNYVQQQQVPNYPNNNMNANMNMNANNGNVAYTYNGYNNGYNNIYG